MTWVSDKAMHRLREAATTPDFSATPYRLIERSGQGGMGVVWLAQDDKLQRRVAIKVLDSEPVSSDAGAENEARILARLEHPGIVPVHDAGVLPDGRLYYVMKFVEGERLDQRLPGIPHLSERLRLAYRICETVAFGHARGVLHCDLKPENIMVGPFGEVLVMDWGLAQMLEHSRGRAAGTPGYMAPEQGQGRNEKLDKRTDVYALGALLRFLVTNIPESPAPDKRIRAIIDKATSAAPLDRYPDAAALAADLAASLDGMPVAAYREGPVERAQRFLSKHRLAAGLVAAYAVVRLLIHILFRG